MRFIEKIAGHLYEQHGEGISSLRVLFPSRRAKHFFTDALSSICREPLWQPAFPTIDELMEEISGLRIADRTRLVAELYKVWVRHHDERFDDFYFWGEALLDDFDSVDKYLVDARMLFTNLADVKLLEADLSYLTENQIKTISFWASFRDSKGYSTEQQEFMKVWQTLPYIYKEYREALMAQGLAYTGMVHRSAAERILAGDIPEEFTSRDYVVAGFNALTECEKRLFDLMRSSGHSEFWWDTDDYWLLNRDHEAGTFMRSNVTQYPMPGAEGMSDEFAAHKEITVVSAPSDTLQCKYVYGLLQSLAERVGHVGKETAVVLADEGLLQPLLYSIPAEVEDINVTMGYPLRQTLVYSFVERLLELQKRKKTVGDNTHFYHSDALGLLRHPFVLEQADAGIAESITDRRMIWSDREMFNGEGDLLPMIFTPVEGWKNMSQWLVQVLSMVVRSETTKSDPLRMEYLTLMAEGIRKLDNSLDNCAIDLSDKIYATLLRRQLQSMKMPYEGEPLLGVQVMGLLETRALDFENVIVLSVNDDVLPGNSVSPSFIPYNLKMAYGLLSPSHQEAIYAYNFYRLLQRAKNIHLVYCSRTDEKRKGEPSRYIYQLEYESPHKISRCEIALDANLSRVAPIFVEKRGHVLDRLNCFLEPRVQGRRKLSPTAFFTYVVCPLKFYFRNIAGLVPPEEIAEQVDARIFGNILHRALELLYTPLIGMQEPAIAIAGLRKSNAVAEAVDRAVAEKFLHGDDAQNYGGNLQLVRNAIVRYIDMGVLAFDVAVGGFRVEALEKKLETEFAFAVNGHERSVLFYGLADRVDVLGDGLKAVVDYKTSRVGHSLVMKFRDIGSLFVGDKRGGASGVVQTMLYAMMLGRMEHVDVRPQIYAVRSMLDKGYSPLLEDASQKNSVWRYSDYAPEFEESLRGMLEELFDANVPFRQCEDERQCIKCDFTAICRRVETDV